MTAPLRHVSDTALWVAMYRALESERPDALFRDPWARGLAGSRGAEILRTVPRARSFGWPMVVRTAVMDEIILRCVARGTRTVINLAAGLDTRAFRLGLPPDLRWFDVDLPEMTTYRREQLAAARAVCLHEDVAADLTEASALDGVLSRVRRGEEAELVITEGLLVYLSEDRVAALSRRLRAEAGIRWWLTDLGTPLLLEMLKKKWQAHLTAANAPMQFAPAEGTGFFTPLGWHEEEFRSTWDESLRLKRTVPLAGLWTLLGKLRSKKTQEAYRKMSGIVLLGRAQAAGES
jgi:methyltransferase (TIGR00027 family)